MKIFWQTVLSKSSWWSNWTSHWDLYLVLSVAGRWSSLQGRFPWLYIPRWVWNLWAWHIHVQRQLKNNFLQPDMREEGSRTFCIVYGMDENGLHSKGRKTNQSLYPTCIRGSPEQTCPGGNHLSESKWCNIMNTWSRKNPARAILARTAMMWRQTMIVQTHLPVQWLSCKTWQAGRWQQWVAPGNSKLPAYLQTVVHCVSFQ